MMCAHTQIHTHSPFLASHIAIFDVCTVGRTVRHLDTEFSFRSWSVLYSWMCICVMMIRLQIGMHASVYVHVRAYVCEWESELKVSCSVYIRICNHIRCIYICNVTPVYCRVEWQDARANAVVYQCACVFTCTNTHVHITYATVSQIYLRFVSL